MQMMFVSGETGDPSPETTGMIEEIVRQQVVEIVSKHKTYPQNNAEFLVSSPSATNLPFGVESELSPS